MLSDGDLKIDRQAWYPQAACLRAFARIADEAGSGALFSIGRQIPENVDLRQQPQLNRLGRLGRSATPGDPEPGRRSSYRLTERGRALEPAIMELGRWGAQLLASVPDPRDRFDLGWALISSKRRYTRAAHRRHLTVELGADQRRFQLRCEPGYVDIREGAPWAADVVLDGSLAAVLDLWMRGVPATQLLDEGRLALVGEPELLADALSSFAGIRWDRE
jgi:hypothetical protein